MKARLVAFSLTAAFALAFPAGAEAGQGENEFLLAGNDKAVWLVRKTGGAGFDIVAKPTGAPWKWVIEGRSGSEPVAVCASSDRLCVLFPSGELFNVGLDGQSSPQRKADDPRWPDESSEIILVEAGDPAGQAVVAVVPRQARPAASRRPASASFPATRPATGPSSAASGPAGLQATLGIFRYSGGAWECFPKLDFAIPPDTPGGVLAAYAGSRLHIYIPGDSSLQSAQLYQATAWKPDIPFSGKLAETLSKGKALALLTIDGKLTLVLAGPVQGSQRPLYVAVFEGSAWRLQQVMRDGAPATWPAESLPLVCRLGDNQIALVRPEGELLKFASCDLLGKLTVRDDVTIFQKPPPDSQKAQEIFEYFMWALFIAAIIPLSALRPKGQRGPFVLPQRRIPGKLLKRLLAAIIDMVPFGLIATGIFPQPVPTQQPVDFNQIIEYAKIYAASVDGAWTMVTWLVLYAGYCTFMETRFGATAGKMLLKLRVVNADARRPTLREAFLRNVFKIIEMFWPLGIPLLLLLPAFNRNRRRLGDMLARTAVIDAGYLAPPSETPPPPEQGGQPTDRPGPNGR